MTLKARRNTHSHHHNDLYHDVEKIKEALVEAAIHAKGRAGDVINDSVENVKERSELLKESIADYAGNKPFKTLGIAFLVGAVVGYLIHK